MILVRFKLDFSGRIFIIWTFPKFGPEQNKLEMFKTIGTGPIEGQGILVLGIKAELVESKFLNRKVAYFTIVF